MIYRRERLMIYKGVPPLMICQTSFRFGLDKKISPTNIDEIFLVEPIGLEPMTLCL